MSRKSPFAPEPATKPGNSRARHEAPTVPPPGKRRKTEPANDDRREEDETESTTPSRPPKVSAVRPKPRTSIPAATVDEVTADLKKDPRRED